MRAAQGAGVWSLLSGHGRVLVAIAKDPGARIRDLAAEAGLAERSTQAIIADLEAAGYITRRRVGRRSQYTVHTGQGFRHRNQDGLEIGPFLELLAGLRRTGRPGGASGPDPQDPVPAARNGRDGRVEPTGGATASGDLPGAPP